ncbi:MAG: hypothetical protein R2745_16155 [Vicinamibacterales bacterium]
MPTFGTNTMSGFVGSTTTFSKYQPRPQTRVSPVVLVHVAPASSDRYSPPSFASTTAYTRRGWLGAMARPMRPTPSVGKPPPSAFQVTPPSVDL